MRIDERAAGERHPGPGWCTPAVAHVIYTVF